MFKGRGLGWAEAEPVACRVWSPLPATIAGLGVGRGGAEDHTGGHCVRQ